MKFKTLFKGLIIFFLIIVVLDTIQDGSFNFSFLFFLLLIAAVFPIGRWGYNKYKERDLLKKMSKSGIKDVDRMDGHQFEAYLKGLFKELGYKSDVTSGTRDFGADLVTQIQRGQSKSPVMPLKVIDSSTLPLNLNQHRWAEFRQTKGGVKLHLRLVFMDKGTSYPEKAVITPAKNHDRNQLEVMVDDKACMYVFDRGYLDYSRFDEMTYDGYFFLSRLRQNAAVRVLENFKIPEDTKHVVSIQMILLGGPQNRAENIFRQLVIIDSQGNRLVLVTNRFDLAPGEISDMYLARWKIELFFK